METIWKKTLGFVLTAIGLVLLILFIPVSCGEPEDEEGVYLHAKVEKNLDYKNVTAVKLVLLDNVEHEYVELARGEWKNDGFTILLPSITKEKYQRFCNLRFLPEMITESVATIISSNKNAKHGIAEFWGINKEGDVICYFYPFEMDSGGNLAEISIEYSNSDINLDGYIEARTQVTDYDEYTRVTSNWAWQNRTIYSIECKEGWNALIHFRLQSLDGKGVNTVSSISFSSSWKWFGSMAL